MRLTHPRKKKKRKEKAPTSPQARTTRGEERAANAAAALRCQITDHFSAFPLCDQSAAIYTNQIHQLLLCYGMKKVRMQGSHHLD